MNNSYSFIIDNDVSRIFHFLQKVNNDFRPKLSERVDLINYAKKLALNAENIFAIHSGLDVGHAGIYINSHKASFLTSIAVTKEFYGQNVATSLLKELIFICVNKNSIFLELEVSKENRSAQKLYLKNGFEITQRDNDHYIMTLILND